MLQTQAFAIGPRVIIDNNASQKYTVIEINGPDRIGFLYAITSALTDSGLQISSAHISTYGERAVDAFYIRDVFGLKIVDKNKLEKIRHKLLASIETQLPGKLQKIGASSKPRKQNSLVK